MFFDVSMRSDPDWIAQVVDSLRQRPCTHDRLRRHGSGDHAGCRNA
jgi:hypothetical protein